MIILLFYLFLYLIYLFIFFFDKITSCNEIKCEMGQIENYQIDKKRSDMKFTERILKKKQI